MGYRQALAMELDEKTFLWVADANGTLMALVTLEDVPTDGTWEILHGCGYGWCKYVGDGGTLTQYDNAVLVVARSIGSGDG